MAKRKSAELKNDEDDPFGCFYEDIGEEETVDLTSDISLGFVSDASNKLPKEGLYISQKRRCAQEFNLSAIGNNKRLRSNLSVDVKDIDLSKLHDSIDRTNVNAVFDPIGDGNCGYTSVAYLRYGDQDRYRDVKKDMLVAFEANKEKYAKFFAFDIVSLEKNIKSDMTSSITSLSIWFSYPDCAQVVADAYNVPVCTYPDAALKRSFSEALTVLPLTAPVKPKMKVRPYHLQNISNIHWVAVEFGHLRMEYPSVSHMYFKVDDSYATLFKTTWNLYGQFPKHTEGRDFNAQKDELVLVESSDEE